MKNVLSLVASTALLITLVSGCGSSSGDSAAAVTTTDITVERGKVYGATVTDSSTPVQTAAQKTDQNVYTFTNTPTYPVKVTSGWIDVNANGVADATDVLLDINMTSYSNIVTPVTTYIADADETIREQRLLQLVESLNLAKAVGQVDLTASDLLNLPSQSQASAIILNNAIYANMVANIALNFENIMLNFDQVETLLSGTGIDLANTDLSALAAAIESELVTYLISIGALDGLTQAYIDEIIPPEVTTGGGTTDIDPSAYETIKINNYAPSITADFITSSATPYIASTSPISCAAYGFLDAPLSDVTGADGVRVHSYTKLDTTFLTRLCQQTDWGASAYAGDSSFAQFE